MQTKITTYLANGKNKARSVSRGRSRTRSSRGSRMSGINALVANATQTSRSRSRSRAPSRVRSRGAPASSQSAGFFKPGKNAKHALDSYAKKGIVQWKEDGGVANNFQVAPLAQPQVLYIGHTTWAPEEIKKAICRSVLKRIMQKADIDLTDFTIAPPVPGGGPTTYVFKFQLWWQSTPQTNVTVTEQSVDFLLNTPNAFAIDSFSGLYSMLFPAVATDSGVFKRLVLYGPPGALPGNQSPLATLDLERTKIDICVKSTLKLQNQTSSSAEDNEADDVNNVPLYGKSYEGTGNGAVSRMVRETGHQQPVPSGPEDYLIRPGNPGLTILPAAYREPPLPSQFSRVQKSGKAHLDPGQIKTSVLNYKKTFYFANLVKILFTGTVLTEQNRQPQGNYRFFCFEKMIQFIGTSTANSIKIAFEVDTKMGIQVSDYRNFQTGMIPMKAITPA